MRLLFWIVAIPALVAAMAFAVSNPDGVSLGLWPLAGRLELPLYAAVTGALLLGFLGGAVIGWSGGLKHRAEARRLARHARDLEDDIARLRRDLALAQGEPEPGTTEATLRQIVAPQA